MAVERQQLPELAEVGVKVILTGGHDSGSDTKFERDVRFQALLAKGGSCREQRQ
jgi:hypothetical protein